MNNDQYKRDTSSVDDETSRYARDMEIIEAASDGPWVTVDNDVDFVEVSSSQRIESALIPIATVETLFRGEFGSEQIANARYIAHFDPTYTKQLVQSLHDVAVERDELREALDHIIDKFDNSDVLVGSINKAKELLK